MLARIAHDLYWLGRHVVRAEHTARMLDGLFATELEGGPEDPSSVALSWESVIVVMGAGKLGRPEHGSLRDDVIRRLTSDTENPASIRASLARARDGAKRLRDTIPAEVWESLNTFHLELDRYDPELNRSRTHDRFYAHVKERSALYWGLTAATMQRDEAHAFMLAGSRIEAAAMILRMLRVALPPRRPADDERTETPRRDGNALALLRAVGGGQAFMRSAASPPRAEPVARFLLFDPAFPDSVAASVALLHRLLARADGDPADSTPALRLARLVADLELRGRGSLDGDDFPIAFREIQHELERVEADIHDRYFEGEEQTGQKVLSR